MQGKTRDSSVDWAMGFQNGFNKSFEVFNPDPWGRNAPMWVFPYFASVIFVHGVQQEKNNRILGGG